MNQPMPAQSLILASEFCAYYQLDVTFVDQLEQQGLVETVIVEQVVYLHTDQLGRLEKLVRLHRELAIHADDLDIVANLLEQLESLQNQVTRLQNRLLFYEPINQ